MSAVQYLLDENVGRSLSTALKRHSSELIVWRIGEPGAPPRGTLDPEILLWCETNGFSLVTNNRSTMPVHLREHLEVGHHVPGIFILNSHASMSENADELILIWGASEAEEYADRISYLPLSL